MQKNSLIETFKELWFLFTKKQKRIFEYLWWMCRNLRHVFPDLQTIAKAVDVSKRTVQNALEKFAELGFITWIQRPYLSNLYLMPEEIKALDIKNPKVINAKPQRNCHQFCHVLEELNTRSKETYVSDVPKSLEKRKIKPLLSYETLPHILKHPFMQKFDYAYSPVILAAPEVVLQEVIDCMKWYAKKHKVSDYCKLLVSLLRQKTKEYREKVYNV